jgi:hypothetical protein
MNPYILDPQPIQDVSGLQPVFQNFGQQQANQQAALAQQNQQVQQAGQTQQQGGMNPMAMAAMLRNQKQQPKLGETTNMFGKVIPDTTYGAGNAYSNMTPNEISNMQQYGV